jgi:flagellar biogenesis protein FliO
MIRLVVATLLLAAIAVTVRLKARGVGPTRSIKVSARAAINRGAVVAIVEAEGRRLLIGAAANSVNVLAELGTVAVAAESEEPASTSSPTPKPLRTVAVAATDDDSLMHKLRRLTTRTADPAQRPNMIDAMRQGTRRHS